jgi:hypothetical protein
MRGVFPMRSRSADPRGIVVEFAAELVRVAMNLFDRVAG